VVQAQPDADAVAEAYLAIEPKLAGALEANRPDSTTEHVSIALPSYSVSETILSHYGERIPSLEHRYLASLLMPARIPAVNIVYISTRRPDQAAIDYYPALLSPERRARTVGRCRIVEWNDGTPRSVAARLVSRPDLVEDLRAYIGGRPALIEPWNVTEHEIALAVALGVPINGTRPELREIGFKGAGRRLFVQAGVPIPIGREDVRTTDDVVASILAIRAERPEAPAVVIKHDDSGAGDGNAVVDLAPMADSADPVAWLRERIDGLAEWYRADLRAGGIVEERITGTRFTSPSAQADILPSGEIRVLATHEQVLGGADDQVYLGCRFPADPAYASVLASHARAIGEQLAARGALGRFGVDFVAADDGTGTWSIKAIEVNLRKGGTTHTYMALRNLVPGRYDVDAGRWIAEDGSTRAYSGTDNLVDPAWFGLPATTVIEAVANAGIGFDHRTGTGVVLHMLSGLAIDGRIGLTAIDRTPEGAASLHAATRAAIDAVASRAAG
jgi:pheganomycin biosynthesis PGM1-like protein/ATP-grasp domain-containing protein